MSRVDDSDNQRIKEMQEAELRQRVDREKRDNEARITKSFNEVMTKRSQGQLDKQANQNKKASEEQQTKGRSVIDQAKSKESNAKSASELSRKAALSRAAQSSLLKSRAVEGQEARIVAEQRTEELSAKAEEDKDRIDREIDKEEMLETARTEEQQTEKKLGHEPSDKVDPDGKNPKQQQRGKEEGKERAEGVETAESVRGPHQPAIPPDVIEKIVSRLFQAISPDGRTSLQMDLKGEGLEGVTLKISSENGRVSCSFEGCSNELKAALRNGKPALTRALAKRGMKLMALRVA
jgi:hypothetical protein